MDYIKLIKKNFNFLQDYGYTVTDEENSVFWKYVRYKNNHKKTMVSVSFDLRESKVSTTFWHLAENGSEMDANSFELEEFLLLKDKDKQLILLPENAINANLSEKIIDEILHQRATIVKEYFFTIVRLKF